MRKLIALLIGIFIFIPLAFTALTLTSIRPWLLDRSFYTRLVSDQRLYEGMFVGELPNAFNRTMFTDDQLPTGALNIALREVVTPQYMQSQAVSIVDQVFDFIDGNGNEYQATFDLTPVKSALTGEAGTRFANTLAAALPACEPGQEQVAPQGHLVRCIAADSTTAEAAEQITTALPASVETMPDRADTNDTGIRVNWNSINSLVRFSIRPGFDMSMFAAVFAAVAVGSVMAYLGGDDRRQRLLWLSSWLLFPAAIFALMGLTISTPVLEGPIRSGLLSASWNGMNFNETFQQGLTDMVLLLMEQVSSGFLLTGIVSGVIALTLMAVGLLVPAASVDQPRGKTVQVPARTL